MTVSTALRRAMGTTVTVTVNGGDLDADGVVAEIDRLERCWSRFLPDSELNRMNDRAGDLTVVSPMLLGLVEHLVAAHRLTGGRFDPTMAGRMVALGYDRTYRDLDDDLRPPGSWTPSGGGDDIVVIPSASTVLLPAGCRLDPGGLGKGLAGDLATAAAMEAGADGALVDLGGDIVTRGQAPGGGPWRIDVPPTEDHPHRIIELFDGAVATSDTAARTWNRAGVRLRHVLDPATGDSLDRDIRASVVAGAGWWAEAAATAAIVSTARRDGWVRELLAGGSVAEAYVSEFTLADA